MEVEEQITVDEGTVFDDPASLFDSSFERIQAIIVKNVSKEFLTGLKAYSKKYQLSILFINFTLTINFWPSSNLPFF